ncbi:MAG: hypothetical protein GY953_05655, partial [bacterium]|nr:hypothetical protein [bacterium]
MRFDVMSYCQPSSRIWISPFHYRKLFDGSFLPSTTLLSSGAGRRRAASSGDFAFVTGVAGRDGLHGELDPVERFTGTAEPAVSDAAGDYCLRFTNAAGDNVGEHCFSLVFRGSETDEKVDEKAFSTLVAWPNGTAKVALRWLGQELDSVTASASAPSVQFLTPGAGDQWDGAGERTISWTGDDADGDSLLYSLFYSNQDNQAWTVLAVDLTGTR